MKLTQGLLTLVVLLSANVVRADEKEDAKKLLVGTWEIKRKVGEDEITGEMTFKADGKVSMLVKRTAGDARFLGTYKVLSATKVELTFDLFGVEKTELHQMKVTKDMLELTGEKNEKQRMKRLK